MPDRPAMAHRLEASTSYYAEAHLPSSPCETTVSGRAEAEQDVNRRVVPQMSTASGPVEAEIQRRVAFALAETQAVPYSPTPKTQPIVGVAPMTPMPVFLGLSQPGSSAQPPAPLLLKAPPDEPPMNGPAMGPVQLKAPPNQDSLTMFRNTINEAHLRRASTYLPINVPAVKAPPPIRLVTGPDVWMDTPGKAPPPVYRPGQASSSAGLNIGLLGSPGHLPQEGFLPEFRVDVAETAEIVLPPNVESLHHWGLALVGFGKHKGSRYREIYHGDPSYIRWLLRRVRRNASPAQLDFIKFSQAMNAQASAPHQPAPTPTPASASRAAPGAPQQL